MRPTALGTASSFCISLLSTGVPLRGPQALGVAPIPEKAATGPLGVPITFNSNCSLRLMLPRRAASVLYHNLSRLLWRGLWVAWCFECKRWLQQMMTMDDARSRGRLSRVLVRQVRRVSSRIRELNRQAPRSCRHPGLPQRLPFQVASHRRSR